MMYRFSTFFILLFICCLGYHKVSAQEIYFYQPGASHSWITDSVSSDAEIQRIESVVKQILKDTATYESKVSKINAHRYYWYHDTLVAVTYERKDSSGRNSVVWVFENDLPVFMKQTVRNADGTYFCKNRYYFSRYQETLGGRGSLFAWTWFGKRVHENTPKFDLVNSALPHQGMRHLEISRALRSNP